MERRRILAMAGAAVTVAAGVVAEKVAINRRRARDPERDQSFGRRRGERSRSISLDDGARLFVEESGPEGARTGVVFLHGSVLRTDVWHYQMDPLGDHRSVFYDLRGHGLSQPKGDSPYTYETHVRDLVRVIEDSELDEVVLVGHSIGGMIVLELCLARPEWLTSRIKGIVLVNTTNGPVTETITGSSVVARLERFTRRPFDVVGNYHRRIESLRRVIRPTDAVFWAVAIASFGPNASATQVDFVYDMLAETPADVIFDLLKCYRDYDVTDRLGEITVPAVVIGGSHDRITLKRASEYLGEHLPKAELKVFDNCGHMAMLERHEEFNQLLGSFVGDNLGRPPKKGRKDR